MQAKSLINQGGSFAIMLTAIRVIIRTSKHVSPHLPYDEP